MAAEKAAFLQVWSRSSAPLVKCIFLHGNYWGKSGLLVARCRKLARERRSGQLAMSAL